MHDVGWQDALVAALALAALGWLVARRVRARKGAACVECPGCSIGTRSQAPGATPAPASSGPGGAFIPLSKLTRPGR
jgi:hypothetical protein